MSVEKKASTKSQQVTGQPIPENLPEELLPLYDWWQANGTSFTITVVVAALVVAGTMWFKNYRQNQQTTANQELVEAQGVDELEATVAKYGNTKVGNATRLRLAKQYYDLGRYEEALAAYDLFLRKSKLPGLTEIAVLGRAFALEGLQRTDEALDAYQSFNATHADHFLKPLAIMGIARMFTIKGDKTGAREVLEGLKAEKTDDVAWEMSITQLEKVIERYTPRAPRSLFDAAEAAAAELSVPQLSNEPAATEDETPAAAEDEAQ